MAKKTYIVEQLNGNKGYGNSEVRKSKSASDSQVTKIQREMAIATRKNLAHSSDTIRTRKR